MQDRHIGDIRVTRIEEQMGPGFPAKDFFPEFDAETFAAEQHWLAPSYYIPESGRLLASIHSCVIAPVSTIAFSTRRARVCALARSRRGENTDGIFKCQWGHHSRWANIFLN